MLKNQNWNRKKKGELGFVEMQGQGVDEVNIEELASNLSLYKDQLNQVSKLARSQPFLLTHSHHYQPNHSSFLCLINQSG